MKKTVITFVLLMALCIATGNAYTNMIKSRSYKLPYEPHVVNKDSMLTEDSIEIIKIGHDYCYVRKSTMNFAMSCFHNKTRIQQQWVDDYLAQ